MIQIDNQRELTGSALDCSAGGPNKKLHHVTHALINCRA